jgi:hypothetical protein
MNKQTVVESKINKVDMRMIAKSYGWVKLYTRGNKEYWRTNTGNLAWINDAAQRCSPSFWFLVNQAPKPQ